ncbi:MAG: MCE family protein [Succiniclasticum sp.]|jgi:phospholipid/cholesterol/gamma-HCH transport system substrate-binding protein
MKSVSEVKVGALTLGGAVLLAGMISFLGAFNLFDRGYDLRVTYPSVNGLLTGGQVRYAGVPVGTVKEMQVDGSHVIVTVHVKKDIQIPMDSSFSIGSDGVMGEKFVQILPPERASGVFIKPGSNLTGTPGGGLDEFMNSSDKVMEKVEGVADAFNNIFGDKAVQQSMREGFIAMADISKNLNRFTKVMADQAEANQADIKNMVAQLSQMSVRLNQTTAHVESLMNGVDNNGATGREVAAMARSLAATSQHVEEVTNMLAEVAKDPQTKKDIQETLHNTRSVTARANKALSFVDKVELHGKADLMHSLDEDQWRGSAGLRFEKAGKGTYLYAGASGLGDDAKLDLYGGKKFHRFDVSAGSMLGHEGFGLGFDVNRDFHIYSQFYDWDDLKIRLGGEYQLQPDVYLTLESTDVRSGNSGDVYMGMRTYF